MRQGRLTIPAALAVTALSVGCPAADDGGETGNDAGTSSATSTAGQTDTGTPSTGATTTGQSSTTTSSTGESESSSTGIDLPDCPGYEEETTCLGQPLCQWVMGLGCAADCEMLPTRYVCVGSDFCYWFEDACHTPI